MPVVLLTTTSASPQTLAAASVPPAGTRITAECWGAGSGASGGSTSFRAGGAGAAYATAPAYVVTPNDVANGISFTLNTGSAGTAAANPNAGTDTSWSTNNLNTIPTTDVVAAVAGTPGTLPTNWAWTLAGGLTASVVGSGADAASGLPYVDIRISGTSTGTDLVFTFCNTTLASCTAGVAWIGSFYFAVVGGSTTNFDNFDCNIDCYNAGSTLISTIGGNGIPPPWPTALTDGTARRTFTGTTPALTTQAALSWHIYIQTSAAIDVTFRVAAPQLELGAATSFWKSTPGYCLAKGGRAPSGTTGGGGGLASACIPTSGAFNGGSGATRTQGGGGGGSAGPAGAGASSTTGTGGTGDNGSGGAAGVSNVEGGGGTTAGTTPATAGAPGGGGGANTSTGSGSTGGRGQIRLTYLALFVPNILDAPLRQRVEMIAY